MITEEKSVQQYCIEDTTNGKYLVIAGPGTGKTYTVTQKIKYMIEHDNIKPNEILCLTFSDTAAREMQQKIGEKYDVNVYTYHAFCMNVIEEFNDDFEVEELNIIADDDKRALIAQCIDELQPQAYNNEKNQRYKFIENILKGIDEIKKSRISTDELISNLDKNPAWRPRIEVLKEKEILEREEKQQKLQDKIDSNYRKLDSLYHANKALTLAQINERIWREEQDKNLRNKKIELDTSKELEKLTTKINQIVELKELYELYQAKMKESNYIDFNDMINIVLDKFKDENSNLLSRINDKYKYIIVDEYQDTNNPQNEIIFELAKNGSNIFVVGDDDQIIYTFQGAHIDTLSKFAERFNPEIKCFTDSWRSSQNILDVSRYLAELQDNEFYNFMSEKDNIDESLKEKYALKLSQNEEIKLRFLSNYPIKDTNGNNLDKVLISKKYGVDNPLNFPLEFYEFEKKEDERNYIINRIIDIKNQIDGYNKNLKDGEEPKKYSDIAILAYKNKGLQEYEAYLKANGIPVEITGGKNIFDIPAVNVFVSYLQFLTNPALYSDKILSYLLLPPFHINSVDYMNICNYKTHHKSVIENIESYLNNAVDKEKLQKFLDTYYKLQKSITSEDNKTILLKILYESEIYEHYFISKDIPNKLENMKGIQKLLELADTYFELNKNRNSNFVMFVNYLNKLYDDGTVIKLDKEDKPTNAVQLSTYHSSKGREFEYVFMPSLTAGEWDSLSQQDDMTVIPTTVEDGTTYQDLLNENYQLDFLDSIKLLYVGMTRAKSSLILSYTKNSNSKAYGKSSWFIEKLKEKVSIINAERESNNEKPLMIIETKNNGIEEYKMPCSYNFEEQFKNCIEPYIPNKFSVSALNVYRTCPKQYFYSHILKMRVNSGNRDDASYGDVIHKTFQNTLEYLMEHKSYPDIQAMKQEFEKEMSKYVFSDPESTKASAVKNIFDEETGYYNEFISIVEPSIIDTERETVLTNTATGKRTIYTEFPLNYEMDMPQEWKTSLDNDDIKIILHGFIDRLDKDVDGKYIIYDYKTKVSCFDIEPSDNYFYQMIFYKFVLEKQFPGIEVKEAYFLLPLESHGNHKIPVHQKFVKLNKDGSVKDTFGEKIQDLKSAIDGIRKMQFDITKASGCTFCPYKHFCKTKTV